MTTLEIHFNYGDCDVVEKVTTYWQTKTHLHVRTFLGDCPETQHYDRNKIIAIFEVEDDGRKEVI